MTEQQKKIKNWLDRLPIRVNNETSDVKAMPKELWCLYKLAPIYELGECCGHSFLLDMRNTSCIENLKEYTSAKEFMINNDINTIISQMADKGLRVDAWYEDKKKIKAVLEPTEQTSVLNAPLGELLEF